MAHTLWPITYMYVDYQLFIIEGKIAAYGPKAMGHSLWLTWLVLRYKIQKPSYLAE